MRVILKPLKDTHNSNDGGAAVNTGPASPELDEQKRHRNVKRFLHQYKKELRSRAGLMHSSKSSRQRRSRKVKRSDSSMVDDPQQEIKQAQADDAELSSSSSSSDWQSYSDAGGDARRSALDVMATFDAQRLQRKAERKVKYDRQRRARRRAQSTDVSYASVNDEPVATIAISLRRAPSVDSLVSVNEHEDLHQLSDVEVVEMLDGIDALMRYCYIRPCPCLRTCNTDCTLVHVAGESRQGGRKSQRSRRASSKLCPPSSKKSRNLK